MTTFQISALPADRFAPLFDLTDAELANRGARWVTTTERPGFPCRISLDDAAVGERVILLSYTHHEADSPYRASGPIYVRQGVMTAQPAPGEIPAFFAHRLLSVRAYDTQAMMIDAIVTEGPGLADAIRRLLTDARADYLHVHNAKPGCYMCTVTRA